MPQPKAPAPSTACSSSIGFPMGTVTSLVVLLQAGDRVIDTITPSSGQGAESLAGASPLFKPESDAGSQPDSRWFAIFSLFDSKYPGTCFLTSLCIHAEKTTIFLIKKNNFSPGYESRSRMAWLPVLPAVYLI